MSDKWISLTDAKPTLVERFVDDEPMDSYGDLSDTRYEYRSKLVLVLFEDGYITSGIYQIFDYEDLTNENYFMVSGEDQDQHGNPLAWMPLHNALPKWFIDEGWGSK